MFPSKAYRLGIRFALDFSRLAVARLEDAGDEKEEEEERKEREEGGGEEEEEERELG